MVATSRQRCDRFYRLLQGVPDDILLSVASRDLDLDNPNACLCGWIVREAIGSLAAVDPDTFGLYSRIVDCEVHTQTGKSLLVPWSLDRAPVICAMLYGGAYRDWSALYFGVSYQGGPRSSLGAIEEAFTRRVREAASRAPQDRLPDTRLLAPGSPNP